MPSPFPGMDPYLEHAPQWSGVLLTLNATMAEVLVQALRPTYFVQIRETRYLVDEFDPARELVFPSWKWNDEERDWNQREQSGAVICKPQRRTKVLDEEHHESHLEIMHIASERVATVLKLLSPANKVPGSEGMRTYVDKRREVLHSDTHWIEIDLLRAGARIPINGNFTDSDYRVHVSRAKERPESWVWPISLPQRLPVIPIPLRPEHPEAKLDLQAVLNLAYDRAGYDLALQYEPEPTPPFTKAQRTWAKAILAEQTSNTAGA